MSNSKECSACGFYHGPPWGSDCLNAKSMAAEQDEKTKYIATATSRLNADLYKLSNYKEIITGIDTLIRLKGKK